MKMKRREFITLLGGAAALPLAARAQSAERRRIAMIFGGMVADDADAQMNNAVFLQALAQAGWIEGRNMRIDYFWGGGDSAKIRKNATELVALAPDVILSTGAASLSSLLQATRTVPIVFVNVADPVGSGFVESLARPGGNATGFIQFEYSLTGKWPELLKQMAPGITRMAVLRDPNLISGIGQFAVIQSVAPAVGVEMIPINLREDAGETERAITAFARVPNGGLIISSSALAMRHRELIIALAAKHKLPAIYYRRYFASRGGLSAYGFDIADQYRRGAGYVDRILKGEKPADLPVQVPTRYELVINLKTAQALGLEISPTLLARADEVIE
jgi:putative tryptophan/tyrosine transport system substrate-binding protein